MVNLPKHHPWLTEIKRIRRNRNIFIIEFQIAKNKEEVLLETRPENHALLFQMELIDIIGTVFSNKSMPQTRNKAFWSVVTPNTRQRGALLHHRRK